MSELTEPAFSLSYNSFISVKVQAYNLRGWSTLSVVNSNGARVEVVPVKIDLPMNGALTTETQVDVYWNPLTTLDQMGGSTCTIISYNLDWDKGTDGAEWEELTGIYSLYAASQFLQAVDVSSGNYYRFKVRAKNKYGWGEMSDDITILAAIQPDAPIGQSTQSLTSTLLSWTLPFEHGSSISQYEILIRDKSGSYVEPPTCLGTDLQIVTERQCFVPYVLLGQSTFNLELGDPIVFQVRAKNVINWGDYSVDNTV